MLLDSKDNIYSKSRRYDSSLDFTKTSYTNSQQLRHMLLGITIMCT